MLYVTCKGCGEEFATGISVGFAGRPVLGAHTYTCPECGHEATYEGEDYHEQQEDASPQT
jgi:RNase P subunit RPR2